MKKVEEFVDDRQKAWCIHCSASLSNVATNEDHVPTKSLLQKPRPHNLPVVTICRTCNNGFSRDEQYTMAFLSCVLSGSTDPHDQVNSSAARALAESAGLRALIDASRTEHQTLAGGTQIMWRPDTARIDRVVLKNARGHAYFEYGEPMLDEPAHVWAIPLQCISAAERNAYESLNHECALAALPEVGSRMLTRVLTGEDLVAGWVVVQEGAYRYAVEQTDGLRVRSVIGEYLATEVQWQD